MSPVDSIFAFNDSSWHCGARTRIMGIVNVTPDSFSDGGEYFDAESAIECGLRLAEAGADCLDVGGESTRPGAEPVSEAEEIRRTAPVVRELAHATNTPISIDTTKAGVAEAAIDAGASIVNDVSAFRTDPRMLGLLSATRVGAIAMHMRGTPKTMQSMTDYDDLIADVLGLFRDTLERWESAGIDPQRLMFDPGIGFGKTVAQNLDLMAATPRLRELGRPILLGPSRKSFIGKILGIDSPAARVWGTVGVCAVAAVLHADVLRVHDVAEVAQSVRMADALGDRLDQGMGS